MHSVPPVRRVDPPQPNDSDDSSYRLSWQDTAVVGIMLCFGGFLFCKHVPLLAALGISLSATVITLWLIRLPRQVVKGVKVLRQIFRSLNPGGRDELGSG